MWNVYDHELLLKSKIIFKTIKQYFGDNRSPLINIFVGRQKHKAKEARST